MSNNKTANYVHLEQFIKECFDKLKNEHFSKWCFMKVDNYTLEVKYLNGKPIKYKGISFGGSTQDVFWSSNYIAEYIKNFCFKGVKKALENSKKFKINPNKCLNELRELLFPKIKETYERMADIEAKLRGDGRVFRPKRNIEPHIKSLEKDIEKIIKPHYIAISDSLLFWFNTNPLITLIVTIVTIPILKIIGFLRNL